MGADPYDYYVRYEPDIQAALDKLRQQVFKSGEYRYSQLQPRTIEEAIENAEADGTASILDISKISQTPQYCCASPLPLETVIALYGTDKPNLTQVLSTTGLFDHVDRLQCIYLITYEYGKPAWIYFAGYSAD